VRGRRRYPRSLGPALRFLMYFTLCPVAVAFAASCMMPSSVWGRRHLIFVAATLLLLVSLSYWRLRSRPLRLLGALSCAVWAFAAVSHHLGQDVRKPPFDKFVLRMLDREKEMTGPIRLFVLERDLHFAPWFYLETLGAKKDAGFAAHLTAAELDRLSRKAAAFEVRPDSTIDEVRGAHFWVVSSTYSWREGVTARQIVTQRGCQVGPELNVADRYRTITAFPVWCAPGR